MEVKTMKDKPFFCEAEKDGYCTSRDYGGNQYQDPCMNCCYGCKHAIDMDCSFVCPKVAEYYYPEEGEEEK
jgi:hypothetical protein